MHCTLTVDRPCCTRSSVRQCRGQCAGCGCCALHLQVLEQAWCQGGVWLQPCGQLELMSERGAAGSTATTASSQLCCSMCSSCCCPQWPAQQPCQCSSPASAAALRSGLAQLRLAPQPVCSSLAQGRQLPASFPEHLVASAAWTEQMISQQADAGTLVHTLRAVPCGCHDHVLYGTAAAGLLYIEEPQCWWPCLQACAASSACCSVAHPMWHPVAIVCDQRGL